MKVRCTIGLIAPVVGLGLALAPAATAAAATGPDTATLTAQSPTQRTENHTLAVHKTRSRKGGAAATRHAKADQSRARRSVSCYNGRRSGRNFYETCRGHGYRPYVDCTNGYRYIFGTYSGTWRFKLTCPAGSKAIWGGAYR